MGVKLVHIAGEEIWGSCFLHTRYCLQQLGSLLAITANVIIMILYSGITYSQVICKQTNNLRNIKIFLIVHLKHLQVTGAVSEILMCEIGQSRCPYNRTITGHADRLTFDFQVRARVLKLNTPLVESPDAQS